MQSLASLMSLQQKDDCSAGSCDVTDVANMADVADEDDVQTCQPILTDIRQLVSRSPHRLFIKHKQMIVGRPYVLPLCCLFLPDM